MDRVSRMPTTLFCEKDCDAPHIGPSRTNFCKTYNTGKHENMRNTIFITQTT